MRDWHGARCREPWRQGLPGALKALRQQRDEIGERPAPGLHWPARGRVAARLGESLQAVDVSKEKADLMHAIYDRITVAGPEIVGLVGDRGGLRARTGAGAARKGRNGAPDRIRTCDLRLRRPTLYPLSYRRAVFTTGDRASNRKPTLDRCGTMRSGTCVERAECYPVGAGSPCRVNRTVDPARREVDPESIDHPLGQPAPGPQTDRDLGVMSIARATSPGQRSEGSGTGNDGRIASCSCHRPRPGQPQTGLDGAGSRSGAPATAGR